jgi:aspartate/methionine/tyrosine aminotransferase
MNINNIKGEPDPALTEPLTNYLGKVSDTSYGVERRGQPELCSLIAADFNQYYGNNVPENHIMLGGSGARAISSLVMIYLKNIAKHSSRKIRAILPVPYYSGFVDQLEINDLLVDYVQFEDLTDEARIGLLREKLVSNDRYVLILNSPNNPNGEVYSRDLVNGIIGLMQEFDNLYVISDSVYDRILRPNYKMNNIYALADESTRNRIFEINSLTKRFSLPSNRFGWLINPNTEELYNKFADALSGPTSVLIQDYVCPLFKNRPLIAEHQLALSELYDFKISLTHKLLSETALSGGQIPVGGIFYWLRTESAQSIVRSLNSEGIALNNGNDSGNPSAIRVNCGASFADLLDICDRIRMTSGLDRLSTDFKTEQTNSYTKFVENSRARLRELSSSR